MVGLALDSHTYGMKVARQVIRVLLYEIEAVGYQKGIEGLTWAKEAVALERYRIAYFVVDQIQLGDDSEPHSGSTMSPTNLS